MNIIGNLIWLFFGGFITAFGYVIGGLTMMLTIIGIPFGFQMIKVGLMCLWPFGSTFQINNELPGCLSTLLNLIWIFIAGFWLAITHVVFGLLLTITIIGIPWGAQHFKLASFAIAPFGKSVVIDG